MKKLLFVIILFSLLSPTFIYTIDETEQVIITELGFSINLLIIYSVLIQELKILFFLK